MDVVRYSSDGQQRVSARQAGRIHRLAGVSSLGALMRHTRAEIIELATSSLATVPDRIDQILPPIDGQMEVWAAGVTYQQSKSARIEESYLPSLYELVYEAARPELFFKAPAWRVVTYGEPVGIRSDSPVNVPEPELALAVNAHGEVVGYCVCNDMSSRTIEGENALYLPQAKLYDSSCALGDAIVLTDPEVMQNARIRAYVERDSSRAWEAETTTAALHRPMGHLVEWLTSHLSFPDGVILATGTGIVPELNFTLLPGDTVTIEIDHVGVLRNPVVEVGTPVAVQR